MAGSQSNHSQNRQNNGGQSGQGPGYHYEYNYQYNYNSPPPYPPGKHNGWGEWIGIIVLFLLPLGITQVIAVIWALTKIAKMSRQQKQAYYQQYRQTAQRFRREAEDFFRGGAAQGPYQDFHQGQNFGQGPAGAQQAWAQPGPTAPPPQGAPAAQAGAPSGQEPPAGKKAGRKKASSGTYRARAAAWRSRVDEDKASNGLIIGGAIMAGVFGLGTVSILLDFIESLSYGFFFAEELTGALAAGLFFAGGLAMLLCGIGGKQRQERYLNYLSYIGTNQEVGLAHMAATFGVPVRRLCKDLQRMLSRGILPMGYLDLAEGKLYLTEDGYRARESQDGQTAAAGQEGQQAERQENAILQEIRQINASIPDAVMNAKIHRIQEITAKILDYQQSHPNRESQLRPFLSYYLPTTLKILRAYAQLEAQGVEGKNISPAKERIDGMMDQVVAGFEKQLDKLFQNDAMDITSDIQVLENMLKKDGLSGDNITLEL